MAKYALEMIGVVGELEVNLNGCDSYSEIII